LLLALAVAALAAPPPRRPGRGHRSRRPAEDDRQVHRCRQRADAPSEIQDVHRRLVAILTRMRGQIADAGAATDFGDDRVYTSVPQQLQTDFDALAALGPVYAGKGYKRLSLGTPSGSR
jgi:hypothetical protein